MAKRITSSVLAVAVVILAAGAAGAGEPVRFGSSKDVGNIATKPQRSARDLMDLPESATPVLNQASPGVIPAPSTTVQAVRPVNEEQQNWIFQDVSTVEGRKRAFGIATGEGVGAPTVARDSTTIIHEYFERRQTRPEIVDPGFAAAGGLPQAGGNDLQPGGIEANPFAARTATGSAQAPQLFGDNAFQSTLNSENPTLRRAFRAQVFSQNGLAPSGFAATQKATAPSTEPLGVEASGMTLNGSQQLSDLSGRMSLIESLSPTAPSLTPAAAPTPVTRPPGSPPLIDNQPLYERRGGQIEIPTRKF